MSKKMNENNHNQSSHFLLGVMIGAAATALFTTKTGRKILKELSENGIEILEEKVDLKEIAGKLTTKKEALTSKTQSNAPQEHASKKRLFKGVKK